ncbi:MAG: ATP-binding cassette domain-containing protein [Chloroflexi bacterium]|nr:MAG: ATP-binding cassette domain-containing protein [Chloroflexota bacterium]
MGTLEVRSLSRIRDGVLLFDEVSFTVPDGRVTAIAGPAMSGKTSLLRVIAGVERSDGGDVLVDGQSLLRLPTERRRLGFLFDDLALFEDMTVRDNVAFGLRMQRRKRVERLRRTDDVLDALGLGGKAHRKPRDLSPGERKRLAFARAVAPEPSLLLLDEPTAGVEEVGREAWRQELAQALRALHVTTVIATTDLRDAVVLADELVLMAEGQVVQTGTVSRVLQGPVSIEAATLAGYVPLVRGEVVEGYVIEQGVGALPFPPGFPLRQQAAVMAHPTALFGVPGGSGLGSGVSGRLLRARPDGPVYVVEIQLNDRSVALRWEWDLTPPEPGSSIEIAVRPGTLRFFNDSPAPRVRTAESATVDPERFAVLAPRVVAGADAPGPRTAQPAPPEEPTEPIEPEPGAAVKATPAPTSSATRKTTSAASTPDEGKKDWSGTQPEARPPEPTSERPDADNEPVTPRPDAPAEGRAEGRADRERETTATRPAGEPLRSPDAAVDPIRTRPNRPTPPPTEPDVAEHSTSYGPSPASAPPPKPDDRHSGMPLD